MERQAVTSKSIRSVGYDLGSKTLEIEFQGGEVYDYFDVPREVYDDFMHAESHGNFFIKTIRDHFPYQHLT
jgi:hypothetical protein